jgi:hypothetical protein
MSTTNAETTTPAGVTTETKTAEVAKTADAATETKAAPSEIEEAERFAAIARQHRKVLTEAKGLAKERAALDAQMKELEQVKAYQQKIEKVKSNPAEAYRFFTEDLGVALDDGFVDAVIGSQKSPEVAALEARIAEIDGRFKAEEERKKSAQEAAMEAAAKASEENARAVVSSTLREHADEFELIAAKQADGLVYDTIAQYYEIHGVVPDIKDIARVVEAHLEQEAIALLKAKKLQSKILPAPANAGSTVHQQAKSLTARSTAGSATLAASARVNGSADDLERAASLLRWS